MSQMLITCILGVPMQYLEIAHYGCSFVQFKALVSRILCNFILIYFYLFDGKRILLTLVNSGAFRLSNGINFSLFLHVHVPV